jgi:hypothetical protein
MGPLFLLDLIGHASEHAIQLERRNAVRLARAREQRMKTGEIGKVE